MHREKTGLCRGPGQEDMSHLIALLDRIGWKMSDAADRQVSHTPLL